MINLGSFNVPKYQCIKPKRLDDKLKPYPIIYKHTLLLLQADDNEITSELHLWAMLHLIAQIDKELEDELFKANAIIPKDISYLYAQAKASKQIGSEAVS